MMESSNAAGVSGQRTGATPQEQAGVSALNLLELDKQEVVSKFARTTRDTGSPEVQIALLTQRLGILAKHFASNQKDHHSKRGMMDLISQRKQLLQYLRKEDVARYRATLAALGLRK